MASPQSDTAEIEYVGFLLGHGGDALQMLALANGMHERGTRVHITVPSIPSSVTFAERCDALGIDCDRSPLLTASMDGTNQSLPKILRLLRSIKAPIVHFHTGNSCLPRTVMVALEVLRSQTSMVTIHSPYKTIVPGSQRGRFWAATARRRMSAVVSPSRHASEFQVRCGVPVGLASTVYNSVDINAVSHGDGSVPRAALGIGPTDQVVLFCSRLDSQKRPLEAVQIFDGVAREFPSAVLVFVGQGSEQGAVEAEAARLGITERVRLVGYQTDVPNWLAAATVWLLPTERENFSLAVLEGLAAGCPVLSTSCPGNDEVLVDRQNALTFRVGDVAGATVALRELLRRPGAAGHAEPERQVDCGALLSGEHGRRLPAHLRPDRSGASRLPGVVIGSR